MDAVINEKIRCVGVNPPIVVRERNLDRLGNDVKNAEAEFFADQEVAFKRGFVRNCSLTTEGVNARHAPAGRFYFASLLGFNGVALILHKFERSRIEC